MFGEYDIVPKHITAVLEPDMGMKPVIQDDIVLYRAIKTFAKLQSTVQTDIVINMIVGRAVVQIDIPTVVAAKAVVPNYGGPNSIPFGHFGISCDNQVHGIPIGVPETVATPRIKGAVVARFQDRIEDIVVFDKMPAPSAVTNINPRPRHIINTVIADRYVQGHGDFHPSRLLFDTPDAMDQVIVGDTFARIGIGLGTCHGIHNLDRNKFIVLKGGRPYRIGISDKAYTTSTTIVNVVMAYRYLSTIIAYENSIPTEVGKFTIAYGNIFGTFQKNGPSPVNCPITAQQGLIFFHKCPLCVFKPDSF